MYELARPPSACGAGTCTPRPRSRGSGTGRLDGIICTFSLARKAPAHPPTDSFAHKLLRLAMI